MAKAQIRKTVLKDGTVRYSAVLEVNIAGERKVVSAPDGPWSTERDAIEAGVKLESKYETNVQKSAAMRGKMTLSEWAEEWLASIEGEKGTKTLIEYRKRLKNWILPTLGGIPLLELDSVHVERWLKKLGHLSTNYRKSLLDTLKGCLNGAVRDKALIVNPAANVKLARTKAMTAAEDEIDSLSSAVKIWDHESVPKLLDAAVGESVEALVILGCLAGLRPGEVEGCKWADIDLMEHVVWVRRADRASLSTKSGKSRRVKLPFDAVRRLVALQERQEAQAAAKGVPASEWVMQIAQRHAAKNLKQVCEKAQVAVLHPHCCRHSFASLLLSAWVPSTVVAKLLGHSHSGITERYYAHAMPKNLDEAPKVLERILNLSPGPVPQDAVDLDAVKLDSV